MNTNMETPMAGREEENNEVRAMLDGQRDAASIKQVVLAEFDATIDVGLRTIIHSAAIECVDASGEETIEIPKSDELRAAVAISRCLLPIKLRGCELKAIRKILGMTLSDLAKNLDDRTAQETVSRWESEAQPMGGYAEKMFRLFVCEELKERAHGIGYNGRMISHLRVLDPWKADPDYEVPVIHLRMIEMKECSGDIIEAWNLKKAA